MGRKAREITEEQYKKIGFLARRLVAKKLIASVLGYTERGLFKRLKTDARLRDTLEDNYIDGKIALSISQYNTAVEHCITHCRTCGRSVDVVDHFFESCPRCDQEDPKASGQHTDVWHEFRPGNVQMLIHLGKHILGQTDRSLLVVKTNNDGDDSRYKTLSEAEAKEADRKLAKLAEILNKEYDPKKELDHNDLLVDIKECA